MISIVIPSYRNPEYLDLCLTAILMCQKQKNDIIVVIDGHSEMYSALLDKFKNSGITFATPQHLGFNGACNMGVSLAQCNNVLLLNEDNVVCPGFDVALDVAATNGVILSVQQVEPYRSIFKFIEKDYGTSASRFHYKQWMAESTLLTNGSITSDAYTFPLFFHKKAWEDVSGLDTAFGTYVSDLDLYYRWQQAGYQFQKTHSTVVYHFVSRSTKFRDKGPLENYAADELSGLKYFEKKHGFVPRRDGSTNAICR